MKEIDTGTQSVREVVLEGHEFMLHIRGVDGRRVLVVFHHDGETVITGPSKGFTVKSCKGYDSDAIQVAEIPRLCKKCGQKPAMKSYSMCAECHDESITQAERSTGVE